MNLNIQYYNGVIFKLKSYLIEVMNAKDDIIIVLINV